MAGNLHKRTDTFEKREYHQTFKTKHTSISGMLKVTGKKVKDSRLEIGWPQYNPLLWQLYLNSTGSKKLKFVDTFQKTGSHNLSHPSFRVRLIKSLKEFCKP